jgi:photosystem II stability/assembly factor-like uncharacterized protein
MRGHLLRSDDAGDSWLEVATGTDDSLTAAVELADGRIAVVGLAGTVLTSDDGGRSFRAEPPTAQRRYTAVAEGAAGGLLVFSEAGVEHLDPRHPTGGDSP